MTIVYSYFTVTYAELFHGEGGRHAKNKNFGSTIEIITEIFFMIGLK